MTLKTETQISFLMKGSTFLQISIQQLRLTLIGIALYIFYILLHESNLECSHLWIV